MKLFWKKIVFKFEIYELHETFLTFLGAIMKPFVSRFPFICSKNVVPLTHFIWRKILESSNDDFMKLIVSLSHYYNKTTSRLQ
jgi:hypothetical protein